MSSSDADPAGLAGQGVGVWVRWMASARDGQVHAFPLDDSQRGRWPQAVCSHVVPRGALGSSAVSPRCPWCVLGVSASGTGRRHRRIDPPGLGARVLARFRRYRVGPQPQPASLGEFPVVVFPPVRAGLAERDGRVPGAAGPGSVPPVFLTPPRPEHPEATQ